MSRQEQILALVRRMLGSDRTTTRGPDTPLPPQRTPLDAALITAVIDRLDRFDPAARERAKLAAILRCALGNDAAPSPDDTPRQ